MLGVWNAMVINNREFWWHFFHCRHIAAEWAAFIPLSRHRNFARLSLHCNSIMVAFVKQTQQLFADGRMNSSKLLVFLQWFCIIISNSTIPSLQIINFLQTNNRFNSVETSTKRSFELYAVAIIRTSFEIHVDLLPCISNRSCMGTVNYCGSTLIWIPLWWASETKTTCKYSLFLLLFIFIPRDRWFQFAEVCHLNIIRPFSYVCA